jgi:MFS family permease
MPRTLRFKVSAEPNQILLTPSKTSLLSWTGLCATSFFLADMNGVTMPFINTYLQAVGWRYDAIGVVAALTGLISLLMNLPGGFLIDQTSRRRLLLAGASVLVGACFGLFPFVRPTYLWIGGLLALASIARPFLGPVTDSLTLALVGHDALDRAVGLKQGWDHAGNIAAAVTAMALVAWLPVSSMFLAVATVSIFAAASVFLIRSQEISRGSATLTQVRSGRPTVPFRTLLCDSRVVVLLLASSLFHLANAPVMPLVAQKVRAYGGSNAQVAGVVLTAQAVMIPMALLAGIAAHRFGHKRVLSVGFAVLPLRIFLYALSDSPGSLVALQSLDGIGAGIFDVTTIAMCADITRGRGRFNALTGALATSVGVGGVIGPIVAGILVQHFGFAAAFATFAAIAAAAAALFIAGMPTTNAVATDEKESLQMQPQFATNSD